MFEYLIVKISRQVQLVNSQVNIIIIIIIRTVILKNHYHNIRHDCNGQVDARKRFIFVCHLNTRLQLNERNLTVSNEKKTGRQNLVPKYMMLIIRFKHNIFINSRRCTGQCTSI